MNLEIDYIEQDFRTLEILKAQSELANSRLKVDEEVAAALAVRVNHFTDMAEAAEAELNSATVDFNNGLKATQEAAGLRTLSKSAWTTSFEIQNSIDSKLFAESHKVAKATMAAAYEVYALNQQSLKNNHKGMEPVVPFGQLSTAVTQAEAAMESAIKTLQDIMQSSSVCHGAVLSGRNIIAEMSTMLSLLAPNLDAADFPIKSTAALQNRAGGPGGLLGELLQRKKMAAIKSTKMNELLNQAEIDLKVADQSLIQSQAEADSAAAALSAAKDALPAIPVAS